MRKRFDFFKNRTLILGTRAIGPKKNESQISLSRLDEREKGGASFFNKYNPIPSGMGPDPPSTTIACFMIEGRNKLFIANRLG